MAAYDNRAALSDVELDHIVSLGVGGAANDPRNLYPEPDYPHVSPTSYYQNPKDRLEDRLHQLVCAGRLSLTRAQVARQRLAGGVPTPSGERESDDPRARAWTARCGRKVSWSDADDARWDELGDDTDEVLPLRWPLNWRGLYTRERWLWF